MQALEPSNYAVAFRAASIIDSQVGEEYVRVMTLGPSSGQKRKVDQRALEFPPKNQGLDRLIHNYRQPPSALGMVERDRLICGSCGRSHWGCCLAGSRVYFRCGQEGHVSNKCPKLTVRASTQALNVGTSADYSSSKVGPTLRLDERPINQAQ